MRRMALPLTKTVGEARVGPPPPGGTPNMVGDFLMATDMTETVIGLMKTESILTTPLRHGPTGTWVTPSGPPPAGTTHFAFKVAPATRPPQSSSTPLRGPQPRAATRVGAALNLGRFSRRDQLPRRAGVSRFRNRLSADPIATCMSRYRYVPRRPPKNTPLSASCSVR